MIHDTKVCLVALGIGLLCLGLAGLSYWAGEALATPRHVCHVTREDHPFWFWFFVILYVIVGILFLYGGTDGLLQGRG
jgi:hypothetical protein